MLGLSMSTVRLEVKFTLKLWKPEYGKRKNVKSSENLDMIMWKRVLLFLIDRANAMQCLSLNFGHTR